jgi:hypothetical protein
MAADVVGDRGYGVGDRIQKWVLEKEGDADLMNGVEQVISVWMNRTSLNRVDLASFNFFGLPPFVRLGLVLSG